MGKVQRPSKARINYTEVSRVGFKRTRSAGTLIYKCKIWSELLG